MWKTDVIFSLFQDEWDQLASQRVQKSGFHHSELAWRFETTAKMDNRPRYRVPDELRETLLDFTIAYLLERPNSLANFGLSFFQRLKDERENGNGPRTPQTPTINGAEENDVEGTPVSFMRIPQLSIP